MACSWLDCLASPSLGYTGFPFTPLSISPAHLFPRDVTWGMTFHHLPPLLLLSLLNLALNCH